MEWRFYPTSEHWPTDSSERRKPAKYVGRTTRMGVEQYQDYTLFINENVGTLRGRYLTDTQLCADWQHEFPDAVTFTPHHVDHPGIAVLNRAKNVVVHFGTFGNNLPPPIP